MRQGIYCRRSKTSPPRPPPLLKFPPCTDASFSSSCWSSTTPKPSYNSVLGILTKPNGRKILSEPRRIHPLNEVKTFSWCLQPENTRTYTTKRENRYESSTREFKFQDFGITRGYKSPATRYLRPNPPLVPPSPHINTQNTRSSEALSAESMPPETRSNRMHKSKKKKTGTNGKSRRVLGRTN